MASASIGEGGIALDSFDGSRPAKVDSAAPCLELENQEALRRIGRQLRGKKLPVIELGTSRPFRDFADEKTVLTPFPHEYQPELQNIARQATRATGLADQKAAVSWLLSSLIVCGVLGLLSGVALLVWSMAFGLASLWQWGMTATIAAEGLLIVGLTAMAVRLWNNGRQVNRQLRGVDRQLEEIQEFAGTLSGCQPSASQHFYHHFHRAASPRMLVANLRGQIDQLAERVQI